MHIYKKDINAGIYRNYLSLCLIVVMDQLKSIFGREFQRRGSV